MKDERHPIHRRRAWRHGRTACTLCPDLSERLNCGLPGRCVGCLDTQVTQQSLQRALIGVVVLPGAEVADMTGAS
jgi:hypothetical protein